MQRTVSERVAEAQPHKPGSPSVEHGVAKSAGWGIAMRFLDRGIGFVSLLILARLLAPDDYGVVAMATSIVALLEALTAFGFEWAIIQRQTAERRHLNTAWTFNIAIAVANACVFVALIPLAEKFFAEPRLAGVMLVLAAAMIVSGFRNVGMVLFEQELRFGPLFMLGFIKKAAGFSVTIAIAVAFHNYWALIVGQFTIALADFAMSYMLSQYRPWFAVSGWRDILPFSKWMYLSNVLTYGSTRATHLIIGNQAGAHALGTYNVAYEVANLPTSELLAPTFRALLPGFSKLKTDIPRLRSLVVDVLSLAALVAIPAAVGIAVLAEQIVAVLLGPKWAEATGLVRVLAIFGAAVAIFSPLNAVNPAVGRVDVGAKVGLLNVLLALPTFTLLMMFSGLVSAAWGLVGARTAAGIVNLFLVSRWLGLDPLVIIRSVWRSAVAAIAMLIAVRMVSSALGQPVSGPAGIWQLFELILLGILCYSAVVFVLWIVAGRPAGAETHMLALLRAAWDRMTRRAAKLQLFRS